MKNTVKTIAEYITEGFTAWEAPLAQESDILYNKIVDGIAQDFEIIRYNTLIEKLGL